MSEEETQKFIEEIREYSKEIASSEAEANKLLAMTGMYTPDGQLKSQFK